MEGEATGEGEGAGGEYTLMTEGPAEGDAIWERILNAHFRLNVDKIERHPFPGWGGGRGG